MLVRGAPIPPPVDDRIKLYMVCSAFEFNHLPCKGGLYDQHPGFIEAVYFIRSEIARYEEQEREREKNKGMGPKPVMKGPAHPTH